MNSISGGQAAAFITAPRTPTAPSAGNALAALTSVSAGSGDGALVANLDAASSGVGAALQSLGSALGSIIDITA